jgi:hypothetical protein
VLDPVEGQARPFLAALNPPAQPIHYQGNKHMNDTSPWRDAIADPPPADALVVIHTRAGALFAGWISPGGAWQSVPVMEAPPHSRKKAHNTAADPAALWMPIPRPPWDPTRTQH